MVLLPHTQQTESTMPSEDYTVATDRDRRDDHCADGDPGLVDDSADEDTD